MAAAASSDQRLDFGRMGHGCEHYRRRCKIRAPCCNEVYFCRHCHNESVSALSDIKEHHELVRQDVRQVICDVCDTEQPVAQVCTNCGVKLGEYFCDICKFYDDDTQKGQFHCHECGICRVGGRENYFHCRKCEVHISTFLRASVCSGWRHRGRRRSKRFGLESMQFLPQDVAFSIASFLQDTDLCLLGSCSRFWRELCASDFIWFSLSKQRWPSIDISREVHLADGEDDEVTTWTDFPHKVGKNFYINWHKVMANRATRIVDFVKQHSQSEDSLEGAYYLRAVGELSSMELSFRDIQLFLFDTKQSVLLNLIGLHYCLFCLGIPTGDVNQALSSYHISERQLSVRWWKLGRWFRGFRLRDESRSRRVSLGELASGEEDEVVGVLRRGAVHEVLRVQISAYLESPSWLQIHSTG